MLSTLFLGILGLFQVHNSFHVIDKGETFNLHFSMLFHFEKHFRRHFLNIIGQFFEILDFSAYIKILFL